MVPIKDFGWSITSIIFEDAPPSLDTSSGTGGTTATARLARASEAIKDEAGAGLVFSAIVFSVFSATLSCSNIVLVLITVGMDLLGG